MEGERDQRTDSESTSPRGSRRRGVVAGGDSQEAGGGQDARTVGTKERQTGGTLGRCGGAGGDEGAEFRRREWGQ